MMLMCCGIKLRTLPVVRGRGVDLWKGANGEPAIAQRERYSVLGNKECLTCF